MKKNTNLMGDLWDKGIGYSGKFGGGKSKADGSGKSGGGGGGSGGGGGGGGGKQQQDKGSGNQNKNKKEDKVYTIRENQKGLVLKEIRRLKQQFSCKIQIDNTAYNGKLGVYCPAGCNDKQGLQKELGIILKAGSSGSGF